ncbi:hypothetical protein H2199_006041 [Coniosporium tulheliwenetii]|uniref:Uncharacterized protein n=1 Tax=Coniosporium tulheliwenetii TaxID=3383036 RepID=A0ACC2YYK9_9PEZI|nr:hypothetical protein H2199_006041 [Cladosporium sp. JES 115]
MPEFPIPVDAASPFPLENIPYGIFSSEKEGKKRAGTAIGQHVVDLAFLERRGFFAGVSMAFGNIFAQETLNDFASLPRDVRWKTREAIIAALSSKDSPLFTNRNVNEGAFHRLQDVEMHLPMQISEFTDFSCFEEHVRNGEQPIDSCIAVLPNGQDGTSPNFHHSPMAYNGRTSSIIPSGTNFTRPWGVFKDPTTSTVEYSPTQKLDYEMEMGILTAKPVPFGTTLTADEASDHIFGFVLLNDWSARDIQMYESLPVGPFNGKAFATSISPWVIVPEALALSATKPLDQGKDQVPTHIRHSSLSKTIYDISFNVFLARSGKKSAKVSTSNLKHSFFTPGQMIAHRSSSGCGMRTGELLGSGTVSSPVSTIFLPYFEATFKHAYSSLTTRYCYPFAFLCLPFNLPPVALQESQWPDPSISRNGCLFELTVDGTRELPGIGGTWLEDGDEVTFEGWAQGANGARIGFGQLTGKILPSSGTKIA